MLSVFLQIAIISYRKIVSSLSISVLFCLVFNGYYSVMVHLPAILVSVFAFCIIAHSTQ